MPLLKTSFTSSASGAGEGNSTFPAKTKKQDKRDMEVLRNLNSTHRELQNCNNEGRKANTAAVICERNIWAVLRGNGIF